MISRLWRWLRRAPKPGARIVFVRLDPRLPADGIMAGLPTAANMISKVSEIKRSVPVARRGPMPAWVGNVTVESALETSAIANQAGLNFPAAEGVERVLKWPFYPTDSLDDGNAANEIPLVGGNWSRGLCILSRYIDVKASDTTRMGAVTFFVSFRGAAVVTYGNALHAMQIAA